LGRARKAIDNCEFEAGLLPILYKIAQYEKMVDKWDNFVGAIHRSSASQLQAMANKLTLTGGRKTDNMSW
jgi:hypothetical protein